MNKPNFQENQGSKPIDILMIVLLIFTIGFGAFSKFQIQQTKKANQNIQNRLNILQSALDPDQMQSVKLQTKKAFYDQKQNNKIFYTNFIARIFQINQKALKSASLREQDSFSANYQTDQKSLNPLLDSTVVIKSFSDSKNFKQTFTPSISLAKNIFDKLQTNFSVQGYYEADLNEEIFATGQRAKSQKQDQIEKIKAQLKANPDQNER